ncbi:sensor domain-containing diguanylate cyclase [Neptuniibacter sp. CAU 1671]|uniref:sensor domain-containing diguanylate cyclase n=1 Tax=Neptuniibacter sp. CAU 1671 TaxID=3032593 RepID=UPI0023D9F193|nr:sensor domain-containing diguanylate cyclase [Neptuniibacter sp. CAU 1671]MDF2182759.1 sensor domain-containing diguanylate cyclase [Neptuniibacter sp. CAU 1671]
MHRVNDHRLLTLCPDPVIGVNGKGLIEIFNPAAETLLGYTAESVVHKKNITEFYPDLATAKSIKRLIYSSRYGPSGSLEGFETNLKNASGCTIPVRLSAALVDAEQGSSIGFFHDLSARRDLEFRLKQLSITDELTGLYNQRHFYTVLGAEISRAQRYNHRLSLICFDLDHFKTLNDSFGHLEGDRVLALVGEVLQSAIRKGDMAFRYGGDEFMLLLPETGLADARKLAERFRLSFNRQCQHSIEHKETSLVQVSMSLGLTESDGYEAVDNLVQRADQAMYQAKRLGGNTSCMVNYHPLKRNTMSN